jgi:putative transposase
VSVTTAQVKRAFKYRFYPTDAQAAELSRTFGCVRKVYNMALAARTEAWARQERVNYNATSAMLTAWKKTEELAYLNEVSSVPLQQTLRHLQGAFTNFFGKRAKYPRFKSRKKSRKSAEYTTSGFRFRDGKLTLAKMAEPLDIVWSRPLPEGANPSTVTVSQDAAGRWFVSMLCEDPAVIALPATDAEIGIDAGLDHLVTLSTGEKIANLRHERKDRARLARAQRELGVDGLVLHDAVAVAEAIWPGILKCRRLAVDVVCDSTTARGATLIDTRSGYDDARAGREIDVALDADIDALRDLLLDKLSGRS